MSTTEETRAAWLADRRTSIGASEAAAACGLSEWATPLDIYCRKRGLLPETPDNAAMRLGRKLEPVVISEFSEQSGIGIKLAPCPTIRHPAFAFISATPDAILETDELLEAKTMGWQRAQILGEDGSDDLPAEIVLQCQQQMAVAEFSVCHVAVLVERSLRTFRVVRHDQLIERLIAAETELWQRIQSGDAPDPDWKHSHTPDLVRCLYGVDEGRSVTLLPDHAAMWERQRECAEQIKALEQEREFLRAKVLHAMGTASVAMFSDRDYELARSEVKECQVSYLRKGYVIIRERKHRANKGK